MPAIVMTFGYEIGWSMDPADPDKPEGKRDPEGRTEVASYARYERVEGLERWQRNLLLDRERAIEAPDDPAEDRAAVDAFLEERRARIEEKRKKEQAAKDAENLEALRARLAAAEAAAGGDE